MHKICRANTYYQDFTSPDWWNWDPYVAASGASTWVNSNVSLGEDYFRCEAPALRRAGCGREGHSNSVPPPLASAALQRVFVSEHHLQRHSCEQQNDYQVGS
jgi:hypothetical protein